MIKYLMCKRHGLIGQMDSSFVKELSTEGPVSIEHFLDSKWTGGQYSNLRNILNRNKGAHLRCNRFTLIELLIVIAIIAILAALLLPALKKAKDLANQTVCLNNNKQLLLAINSFTDDHSMYPPYLMTSGDPASNNYHMLYGKVDSNWWGGLLAPYLGSNIFDYWGPWRDWHLCPVNLSTTANSRDWIAYNTSFGYAYAGGGWNEIFRHVKPIQVVQPSKTAIFADKRYDNGTTNYYCWVGGGTPDYFHHGTGAIYGFADGHAESINGADAARRYSLDFVVATRTYFRFPVAKFLW